MGRGVESSELRGSFLLRTMEDFFGHLQALGAEHERLHAENTELRRTLATFPEVDLLGEAGLPLAVQSQWSTPSGAALGSQAPLEEQRQTDAMAIQLRKPTFRAEPRHGAPPRTSEISEQSPSPDSPANPIFKTRGQVFDLGDMKEKMKNEMMKDVQATDATRFYKQSGCSQFLVRHHFFENTTMAIIVIYAIWMSVDTDYNTGTTLADTSTVFIVGEQFFCTFFTGELLIRFLAFERKANCLKDGWFVFDSILVAMMVAETWILNVVILSMSASSADSPVGDMGVLRLMRLARLTRLFRMAKLLRLVPELIIMVKAIAAAARSVSFAMGLLLILIYVFGIAFTSVLKDSDVGASSFPNVLYSMHSLVMHGAFCDDITGIMTELIQESYIAFTLMYVLMLLAAVTIMNMLIGILCEVITAVADAEREAISFGYVKETLQRCLSAGVDQNNDGIIDQGEFLAMLENPAAIDALREIDIDVVSIYDYIPVIFGDSEDGKETKSLPFNEFLEVLLQLRGGNSSTVKDLVDLRKWLTSKLKDMEQTLKKSGSSTIKSPSVVERSNAASRQQTPTANCDLASEEFDKCSAETIFLLPGQPVTEGDA